MARTVQISVVQPVTLLEDVTRLQGVVMADVNRDGLGTLVIRRKCAILDIMDLNVAANAATV